MNREILQRENWKLLQKQFVPYLAAGLVSDSCEVLAGQLRTSIVIQGKKKQQHQNKSKKQSLFCVCWPTANLLMF